MSIFLFTFTLNLLPNFRFQEHRTAKGGNYLCAHLRRADFLHGRDETTPSLRSAATQVLHKLKELHLKSVFISSDCTGQEYRNFKSFLSRYRVTKFTPSSNEERDRLKPGGIAIVDQIICSHARWDYLLLSFIFTENLMLLKRFRSQNWIMFYCVFFCLLFKKQKTSDRFFIGTYESTFTYRIYEEREILGFPTETTFNTFCKSPYGNEKCSRNAVWPIVF